MTASKKVLFWVFTIWVAIDYIYWQWSYKVTIEPTTEPPFGVGGSMILDLIILIVWLYYLIKIYRIAFSSNPKENSINEQRAREHQVHLDHIMDHFSSDEEITNDKVEKLLGVSDTTVGRYLDELEKQDKLQQVGRTGKYVTYRKI